VTSSTRIRVAFGDTDPAGLVYYPNLLHYCHLAMEHFFAERCGIPYSDLIAKERIGFPTVKIEAEFLTPLIYGDDANIAVDVAAIGTSSLTLVYTIQRVRDQIVCARVEQVHVAISLQTKKSQPIPSYLRENLIPTAR
jgi:4-hydroxybenzoyl-CoA thioesterase